MKAFIFGIVVSSLVLTPVSVLAEKRKPVEPTGKAREMQYKKAVEWCRNKFPQYMAYNVIARWESHWGHTGWHCAL